MNFIVFARGIPARQWIGRLLNEAGFCREHVDLNQTKSVHFVRSVEEANQTARPKSPMRSFTIVWTSTATALEVLQLTRKRSHVILVNQSTTTDSIVSCIEGQAPLALNDLRVTQV